MAEMLTPYWCSSRIMTISPSRTNDASPEAEKGTSSLIDTGGFPGNTEGHAVNSTWGIFNRHKWGLFGRHSQLAPRSARSAWWAMGLSCRSVVRGEAFAYGIENASGRSATMSPARAAPDRSSRGV